MSELPARPSLEWLRKTAKQRLGELREREPEARLADAQREVAREHGFASWRRLVAFVEAVSGEGDRLRAAVRAGDEATVAALLDETPELVHAGEDLDERVRPSDERRMSLLHLAVAEGSHAMVRLLIARGVPLGARNAGGRMALHDSFELGHDSIGLLLIDAGAPLDACGAAVFRKYDRLAALLAADPAQANDLTTGLTPLGWSSFAHDGRSARILIDHGAIVDRPPFAGHAWRAICKVAALAVARVLLERGADPNHAEEDGDTPLHLLIASRLVSEPSALVGHLLAAGADPDRRNRAGRSPLDAAIAADAAGAQAEIYFPQGRALGPKRLGEAIRLMRAASRASVPT